MPSLSTRRAAAGCLVVFAALVSAGPVWAQQKPKASPKASPKSNSAKAAQTAPAPEPAPAAAPPGSHHYPWVPEQVRERVSPFVVDVVLGVAGAGAVALLLLASAWLPPARPRADDPLAGVPGQHRRKLGLLAEGETILWASAGSDRVRRRNAGAAVFVGL